MPEAIPSHAEKALEIVGFTVIVTSIVNLAAAGVTAWLWDSAHVNLFDLLNLFAGTGLLRRSSRWRRYLVIYLWLFLIMTGLMLIGLPHAKISPPQMNAHRTFLAIHLGINELLFAGCLYVLTRPEIKKLFPPKDIPPEEL